MMLGVSDMAADVVLMAADPADSVAAPSSIARIITATVPLITIGCIGAYIRDINSLEDTDLEQQRRLRDEALYFARRREAERDLVSDVVQTARSPADLVREARRVGLVRPAVRNSPPRQPARQINDDASG